VTYSATSGVAQKGPLIKGATVTAQELDASLSPTGKQYSYQITSDLGTFTPNSAFGSQYIGGERSTARVFQTATLLSNGKVLVTGGTGALTNGTYPVLSSAELYDPTTNSWSAAAPMSTPHSWHTATLLGNGEVLVAAGQDANGVSSVAEMYDPTSDSWSTVASLSTARQRHTATLLANGKVLVTGGTVSSTATGGATAGSELYDPSSDTWTAAASLQPARFQHKATLLPNGKVLVEGGLSGGTVFAPMAAAEIYDPTADI
jgi:trimeric autotransporter adhesin